MSAAARAPLALAPEPERPKRKRRRSEPRAPRWSLLSMLGMNAQRGDGRMLGVIVDPTTLSVLAFEGPAPQSGQSESSGIDAFFGDHAHAVVCERASTLALALDAAESYARRWGNGEVQNPRCECPELEVKESTT